MFAVNGYKFHQRERSFGPEWGFKRLWGRRQSACSHMLKLLLGQECSSEQNTWQSCVIYCRCYQIFMTFHKSSIELTSALRSTFPFGREWGGGRRWGRLSSRKLEASASHKWYNGRMGWLQCVWVWVCVCAVYIQILDQRRVTTL